MVTNLAQVPAWLIEGIPFGCVYALIAIGIVLTYKTTGVFNFAYAAQAFVAAAVYVELVEVNNDPRWIGLVVAILIVSPLLGLAFDRFLFRAMRSAGWQVKLVTVLGMFIALPQIVLDFISGQQPVPVTTKSSIPPMLGINAPGFNIGTHFVSWDFAMAAIVTVAAVLILGFIFRYTAIGLQMRAVVESPRMVELAGVNSERVSAFAWMLSSVMAGIAGVILATLAQTLNANIFVLLLVITIAAAAVGRLTSIPVTFFAGVALGVADRALPDILQSWFSVSSSSELAKDLRPSLPFLVLFLILVLARSIRSRRESADPLAGVDPPPPAMAHSYKTPELERLTKIIFPIFIGGFLLVMLTIVSGLWVFRITDGLTLAVAFLSITIITGFAGQISLAQATFAGIGGFTAANLAVDHGVPILLGVLIGAVLAAVVGALFSLPAIRLGGIYLTLATLAFGLMVENVVFNRPEISNGAAGIHVPRPDFATSDRTFFLLIFAVFAVVAFGVILIRKGTTGRFFMAIRGSETAAASIGINATALRITLFATSAAVAGIGGGLIAMSGQDVRVGDAPTFPTIIGIAWVVLVVTLGSRTVDGAVNAGISFVVFQWLLEDGLHLTPGIFLILFGLGAITYARHPEGIVEYQTRRSLVEMGRARALAVRAKGLAAKGELPETYTRVARVVVPVAAGPALYLLYLLARTATQLDATIVGTPPFVRTMGHWADVHSATLLPFVLPSVAFLFVWMLWADRGLARQRASRRGPLVMLGGAAGGALFGWALHSSGHISFLGVHLNLSGTFLLTQIWGDLPGSTSDCVLLGVLVGAAFVMFLWLPWQVERVAKAKGWLESPLTWKDGRIPAGFLIIGVYLFSRMQTQSPPSGWPVAIPTIAFTIVWLQWVASVQGGINELAIGNEGETRRLAEGLGRPETQLTPAAAVAAPVPAPAGGSA
ncbi:MAG TPA: ABC transporter permease [Acidimicrobiia bacterium]|nr:ABC transporter permease [Acidimicrobiia bacterium]